ncbi:MAG: site-specific DNA-methyltransferase, partial [Planctomycetota bacterium]
ENSKMKGGRKHFGKRGGTPEAGKNGGSNNLHDGRWDQAFHPGGRNKRTVWSIPLSKFREAHFAVYPQKLVQTCIDASCPPEGIVLDPFSGAGTTALAASDSGRHFVAFDCVREYNEIARKRLASAATQLPQF